MGTTTQRPHPTLLYLDVTQDVAVKGLINTLRPHVVIHCAAYTHVDGCETNPALSERVNVEASRSVAQACADIGAKMVFFSSEYIFDGVSGPYGEEDIAHPINVYGKHKLAAEMICRQLDPSLLIIRPTVVYSYLPTSKNFAMQLIDSFEKGTPITAIADQLSTPTYAPNLASLTWELVNRGAHGVFNIVGPERMGRDAFALIMAEVFGFTPTLVRPAFTCDVEQKAKRPLNAGLLTTKLETFLGIRPIGVRRAMEDMKQLASIEESG